MKYLGLAFLISLALHFLLFNNYQIEKHKESEQKEEVKKSSVHYVQLKKKQSNNIEKKPAVKPIKNIKKPKKSQEPKKVQRPKKKLKPKKIVKKQVNKQVTKAQSKQIDKKIKEQETKKLTKNENKKTKSLQDILLGEQIVNSNDSIQKKTLENYLEEEEKIDPRVLSEVERIYGREFNTFTKVQKAFIKKNFLSFRVITQKVLNRMGYPRLAARLRLSGVNVVEFLFHPDGSINNLKITDPSGYEVFDKYTLELIEIAYKDYPKPKTATKIKFNVTYKVY
jgi:protein TonB